MQYSSEYIIFNHILFTRIVPIIFTASIPLSGGSIGVSLQADQLAQVSCTGNESSISSCNLTSATLNLTTNQQARVRCFFQEGVHSMIMLCSVMFMLVGNGT